MGNDTVRPATDQDAWDHVHDTVRRAGSSFYWAMRILAKRQREAVYAIYAFCREVDDIADEEAPDADKRRRLADWRREVELIFAGAPTMPTARALHQTLADFELPKHELLRLIDAVSQDTAGAIHAPAMADLRDYCRGVAGAVGLLLLPVFGDARPPAQQFAVALGEALQLTNILRDIDEDAERGRVYLPRELLEAEGIAAGTPVEDLLRHPALPSVCDALARMATARFQEAESLLVDCDRHALRSALVMKDVYARVLARLERRGWHDLAQPVRVPGPEKLWIALRYAFF